MLHECRGAVKYCGDVDRFMDVAAPLEERAEAMVARRAHNSRHRRGAASWSTQDEAAFRAWLAELHTARARFLAAPVEPATKLSEDEVRMVIDGEQLHLRYQPIVDIARGRIVAAEALTRWRGADGPETDAASFISVAERSDLIHAVTCAAIRNVRRDLGDWLRGRPKFQVSVNIVSDDLQNAAFQRALVGDIEEAGISPKQIVFEITERRPVQAQGEIAAINDLKLRGYSFFIDDFGCGYSNISYLSDFEANAIKIDRSFTSAIGRNSKRARLFEMIVRMAQDIDMPIIVEGVETAAQAEFCRAWNVTLLQGWHFSRPVTAAGLKSLLRCDMAEH